MKKVYIKNFCKDLNFEKIILFASWKDCSDDALLSQLNADHVEHLYFFDSIRKHRLFYIEHNALTHVIAGDELLMLLNRGYSVLQLRKDDDGFYYEVKKSNHIPETKQEKRYVYEVCYDDDWEEAHFSYGTFDSEEKAKAEMEDRLDDYDLEEQAKRRKNFSIRKIEVK